MYVHGCDCASNMACRIGQAGLGNGGLRVGDGDGGAGFLATADDGW
jgi:hypothetical protein